jgi:hypothetical protein
MIEATGNVSPTLIPYLLQEGEQAISSDLPTLGSLRGQAGRLFC